MHGLKNQCSSSALPQTRSCPRRGVSLSSTSSQQTLHGFPGPRACGASPAGIQTRGTGRETVGLRPECALLGAVQCGGWCGCSFLGVAVFLCVWLVAGLRWLVMDEVVVMHTVVVGGLLCLLCVQLHVVLQLCICPLDGGDLHVTYCGFGFWGVVGDDPVELQWYHSPEVRFVDFQLLHQAPDFICWRRDQAPIRRVLLWCPPVSTWPGRCLPEPAGTV